MSYGSQELYGGLKGENERMLRKKKAMNNSLPLVK